MKILNFYNDQHKEFYENCKSTRKTDPYHASLIYLLGLTEDTRKHFAEIYDLEAGEINIETLEGMTIQIVDPEHYGEFYLEFQGIATDLFKNK